eukprot:7209552-Alexandrium_andersonii.AAC.1
MLGSRGPELRSAAGVRGARSPALPAFERSKYSRVIVSLPGCGGAPTGRAHLGNKRCSPSASVA